MEKEISKRASPVSSQNPRGSCLLGWMGRIQRGQTRTGKNMQRQKAYNTKPTHPRKRPLPFPPNQQLLQRRVADAKKEISAQISWTTAVSMIRAPPSPWNRSNQSNTVASPNWRRKAGYPRPTFWLYPERLEPPNWRTGRSRGGPVHYLDGSLSMASVISTDPSIISTKASVTSTVPSVLIIEEVDLRYQNGHSRTCSHPGLCSLQPRTIRLLCMQMGICGALTEAKQKNIHI